MAEPGYALCVDFGSTFTKAALVDLAAGQIVAGTSHRTTIDTDVMDGFEACQRELGPRAKAAEVLACSSAGGGLRIAVVGNEELVTAEAGRRVALSSGGTVVEVRAQPYPETAIEADVVLLTGGTDGGNAEALIAGATHVQTHWDGPVVVAGNIAARAEVATVLDGLPVVFADNVVPRIGVLAPDSARSAIRDVFLRHVIGGKGLSRRSDFTRLVLGATPDVVLQGVEVLAEAAGDVVVVDVGGATTDVHSVVELDPEDATLGREVIATTPVTRTVEGDLGMRWSARTTAAAGGLDPELAQRRADAPGFLPTTPQEVAYDVELAAVAVRTALQRHAGRSRVVLSPEGRVVERSGKDLREVDLFVGSGGVLRADGGSRADAVLAPSLGEQPEGWQLPRAPLVLVDADYALAAIGLLSQHHREVAARLARRMLNTTLT